MIPSNLKKIAIFLGSGIIIGVLAILVLRAVTGRSLGLKSFIQNQIRSATSLGKALIDSKRVRGFSHGDYTNVIFIHHSVGNNLIEQGKLREKMQEAGFDFWDLDYNDYGLTDPSGNSIGYSYNIPDDNTDPDGYADVFSQRVFGLPVNALSGIMQHEVILFKSCFPANDIISDEQLSQYQQDYLVIRNFMEEHPDKLFVVITVPPLNPAQTRPDIAARARIFANWLKSEEYLGGRGNIFAFDLFDSLAEPDPSAPDYNMLRQSYREGDDSHPNLAANEAVTPLLVEFVTKVVKYYRTDGGH